jgi:hypothetical protein
MIVNIEPCFFLWEFIKPEKSDMNLNPWPMYGRPGDRGGSFGRCFARFVLIISREKIAAKTAVT